MFENVFYTVDEKFFVSCPLALRQRSRITTLYAFIAFPPIAPRMAEATAMTTFKMVSQRDFLVAIVKSSIIS